MFEFGIGPSADFASRGALKRAALLVESLVLWPSDPTKEIIIGVHSDEREPDINRGTNRALVESWRRQWDSLRQDVEWLEDRGFLRGVLVRDENSESRMGPQRAPLVVRGSLFREVESRSLLDPGRVPIRMPRVVASALRSLGKDAVPLYGTANSRAARAFGRGVDTVVSVALKALPVPDALTPWEEIFAFRSDTKTAELRRRFMRWMRKTAAAATSDRQIEEELQDTMSEYERHMRLWRLKSSHTGLESLFVIPVEIAEHLLRLQWSEAVRTMFVIKRRRAELLQAEIENPGREVAYVIKARRAFGSPDTAA